MVQWFLSSNNRLTFVPHLLLEFHLFGQLSTRGESTVSNSFDIKKEVILFDDNNYHAIIVFFLFAQILPSKSSAFPSQLPSGCLHYPISFLLSLLQHLLNNRTCPRHVCEIAANLRYCNRCHSKAIEG